MVSQVQIIMLAVKPPHFFGFDRSGCRFWEEELAFKIGCEGSCENDVAGDSLHCWVSYTI